MKPSQAVQQFDVAGRLVYINAITRGNVNDTYEAVFRAGASVERVIVQRINTRVFPNPEWIMENMRVVTEHLRRKVAEEALQARREWGFPQIIRSREGKDLLVDEEGSFWRVMTSIDFSTSYEKVRNAEHAQETGTVLGFFHRMISDIDAVKLHDTLPGFHICPRYLAKYEQTLADCGGNGLSHEVDRLRNFIDGRKQIVGVLEDALAEGKLRTRLIHGDPKVDNIMIDDFTGKGIAMIDLDTVKPGLIHYDFGDALRSICNPAGEEASDLKEVLFDVGLCEAFVKGYMIHAQSFLTEADRALLYDSVRLLAFELGLRFFEDHLAGDVYFKVRFEEHNLNRARVQFKLCESIEAEETRIRTALGG